MRRLLQRHGEFAWMALLILDIGKRNGLVARASKAGLKVESATMDGRSTYTVFLGSTPIAYFHPGL